MATYGVTDTQLTAIANAIRLKRDIITEMEVDDMPLQISLIDTGGGTETLDDLIDRSITSIASNTATSIGTYAFYGCANLTTVNFAIATSIGEFAFGSCGLVSGIFQNVTSIGSNAFRASADLEYLKFSKATTIGQYAFRNCSKFKTLIIETDSVCALPYTSAFNLTPFDSDGTGGTLYVPRDLIASYQIASNWSTYLAYPNNQILAIEDMA